MTTDVRDALRMVAQQGGVTWSCRKRSRGSVSLELDGVSLSETLDAIVSVGGFEYTIEGSIVTVASLETLLAQEKLRMEYADGQEVAEQEAMVIELRYVDADRMQPVIEGLLSENGSVELLRTSDHVAKDYELERMQGLQNVNQNQAQQAESSLQVAGRLQSTYQGQPARSHTARGRGHPGAPGARPEGGRRDRREAGPGAHRGAVHRGVPRRDPTTSASTGA